MTPFGKATRLISSMIKHQPENSDGSFKEKDAADKAKQCALILVDEVLEVMAYWELSNDAYLCNTKIYWLKVKQEIEKL